ncbi:hypothetical protein TIFTF001_035534 [Ficus carica]|uniref:Uncharacterized protein n=1 Tax=Ficus carica TaxID=3494 RepID=A0AA88J9S2_FICCA|nr:hypothetical protein TIFTF001_035513 [Ficus carica]GMN66454.1 hypothetical protein TIFTF001_035516 [Ficus carica]GMN66459.1 hypothetical protein TIFTF001_035531 [Ficus carica]GMN66472.1 hypothetical protein TIFTF001_035534 [Ficus carica]
MMKGKVGVTEIRYRASGDVDLLALGSEPSCQCEESVLSCTRRGYCLASSEDRTIYIPCLPVPFVLHVVLPCMVQSGGRA